MRTPRVTPVGASQADRVCGLAQAVPLYLSEMAPPRMRGRLNILVRT